MRTFFAFLVAFFFITVSAKAAETYTVVRGDTLSGIAKIHNVPGGWTALYAENKGAIKNPNLIYPGQEIKISVEGEVDMAPVEVRPAPLPLPAPLPDSRQVEVEGLRDRLGEAERRMTNLEETIAKRAKLLASLEEEKNNLEARVEEYQALLSTPPWHREILPQALPGGWPVHAVILVLSLLALSLLFLKKWRALRTARAMLGNERREKWEYIGQADHLMGELAQARKAFTTEPIEEVLADRQRFREEEGLPKEKRGEVLHAVLKHCFSDLAEDRKSALRATLRFFFPEGSGLHRQNGAEVMVPCSGGNFSFGENGSVGVSFYARPGFSGEKEVNFDKLKSLIEVNPEIRESLGIPEAPAEVPAEEVFSHPAAVETVSTSPEISQADKEAAYREMIARGRDEIKEMRERASGVPEFRSRVGTTT
jgi:LysM repeat protein